MPDAPPSSGGRALSAVYLASPLGFDEPGRRFRVETLLPVLKATGWQLLDPWASSEESRQIEAALALPSSAAAAALGSATTALGRRNVRMLDAADAVLAWLDGVDLDSGTAAEVGYAAARGKPVVGVRTDFRLAGDHFATRVNLQVEHFIVHSGGRLCSDLHDAVSTLQGILDCGR